MNANIIYIITSNEKLLGLANINKHKLSLAHRLVNIMDSMVVKLEKYATNLEDLVASRTGELLEEKKKTYSLLYRMLPR